MIRGLPPGKARLTHLLNLAPEVPDGEVVPEPHHHDKNGLYEGVGDLREGHSVQCASFLSTPTAELSYPEEGDVKEDVTTIVSANRPGASCDAATIP
jgi:hypothetical protein